MVRPRRTKSAPQLLSLLQKCEQWKLIDGYTSLAAATRFSKEASKPATLPYAYQPWWIQQLGDVNPFENQMPTVFPYHIPSGFSVAGYSNGSSMPMMFSSKVPTGRSVEGNSTCAGFSSVSNSSSLGIRSAGDLAVTSHNLRKSRMTMCDVSGGVPQETHVITTPQDSKTQGHATTTGLKEEQNSMPNPADQEESERVQKILKPSGDANGEKGDTLAEDPETTVLPRSIGPVVEPNCNDVVVFPGGSAQFPPTRRAIMRVWKSLYEGAPTHRGSIVISGMVKRFRRHGCSRFLEQDQSTGLWWDVGDAKARDIIQRALCEGVSYRYAADPQEGLESQNTGSAVGKSTAAGGPQTVESGNADSAVSDLTMNGCSGGCGWTVSKSSTETTEQPQLQSKHPEQPAIEMQESQTVPFPWRRRRLHDLRPPPFIPKRRRLRALRPSPFIPKRFKSFRWGLQSFKNSTQL